MRFTSRINMTCVNQSNGAVRDLIVAFSSDMNKIEPSKFATLGNWKPTCSIETILTELRKEMTSGHNRKLQQPPEGTMF